MVAVVGFFVLAFVGWASDVPLFACSTRALVGAAALYVVTTIAGRLVIRVVTDEILRNAQRQKGRTQKQGKAT